MSELRNVRVAAIQATPVILDAEASVAKAVALLEEAAAGGAELAVLPETFIPLYPSNKWARGAAAFGGWDELWERLHANAVEVPGALVDEIAAACERLGLHVVVGVNEREGGSLYNAYLLIGPEGLLHRHRKLMPTQQERLFHGIGAGDDLAPVETPIGRIGGLICWENRMPLARWAVYQGTPQIWCAPTADDSDGWVASMRHIAMESGAFVVSVPQYIPGSAFPEDFPVEVDRDYVYGRGGAVVVEPTWGNVIAGPLYDAEGIVYADCDLRVGLHAKRWFDAVGHYGRTDVLFNADCGIGFVIGTRATGRMVGEFPGLDKLDGLGNLRATSDFRGLYSSLAADWFGVDPGAVFGAGARRGAAAGGAMKRALLARRARRPLRRPPAEAAAPSRLLVESREFNLVLSRG